MKKSILILLLSLSVVVVYADRTVSGVVKDSEGLEVIGATVLCKGTIIGTTTDVNGKFVLTVPDKATEITISYIGHKTATINITKKDVVNVTMEQDAVMLEEVVSVGYGTQRKVNLTGAIENVDMSSIGDRTLTNASLALQGQVSGVLVVQESGQAGADDATIRIRGISSIENNNAPLVIIDGVEGNLNEVDTKDIESMTVMKDASSAAIYGNKAAAGVILITTRRGKEDMFQVNYSFTESFQQPTRLPEVVGAKDYLMLWNEANRNDGTAERWDLETEYAKYDNGTKRSFNWYDLYFKTAPMQKHYLNLILSAGNVKTSTSFNYMDQKGMLYGTDYNRFNYRTNIEATTKNKKVKLEMHIAGYRDKTGDNTASSQSVLNKINSAPPYTPFVNPDSDPNDLFSYIRKVTDEGTIYSGYANYIGYKENNGGKTTIRNRATCNFALVYEPIKGLNFEARYAFGFLNNSMKNFLPVMTLQNDVNNESGGAISSARAELTELKQESYTQNLNLLAKYDNVFKQSHHFGALLGFSLEDYKLNGTTVKVSNFVTSVGVLDYGEDVTKPKETISNRRALSVFGRLNYSYKERYLVEFNLRGDGSSRFRKGHRWGLFPSASVGWRISQEEWYEPAEKVLSNLKIRASYGMLGNEAISSYYAAYDKLESDVTYSFEGKDYNAIRLTELADKNTTWEKTSQADVGLDMQWIGRLNMSLDLYYKHTYDILARVQMTSLLGTTVLPYQNIGEMENKGWELSLSYKDKLYRDLHFWVNANISGQANKFLKLNNTDQDYVFNAVAGEMFSGYNMIITKVGYSYGSYYGYQVDRIFQVDDFIWQNNSDPSIPHEARNYTLKNEYPTQAENPRPGDLKFRDLDQNGEINDDDRTIIGKQLPDIMYSFGLGLNWKGLEFSCFFQGVAGGQVYTGGYLVSPFYNSAPVLSNYLNNRWTIDNPSTEYQRVYIDKTKQKIVSDYYVEDASYLRLKSIELAYTFPQKWMSKIRVKKFKIFGTIQNAWTWSKTKSFDPEKMGNVVSSDFHPQARIYSVGAEIMF